MTLVFRKTALVLLAIFQLTQGWQLVCYLGSFSNSKSVTYKNAAELITSGYFNVTRKTVVYAHGYRGNLTTQGTNDFLAAYLGKFLDRNVCAIDYEDEANFGLVPLANFPIIVAVAYLVQQQIAEALKIWWQHGMNPEDVHMIGFSLGAHLCGNAARTFSDSTNTSIGRVTGLDPAKPFYDGLSPNPRIDHTCAKFVDIIHTDTNRYGMATYTGLVDIIVNIITYRETGVQPGCQPVNVLVNAPLTPKDACSHRRAVDLYIDSLTDECQLLAAKAADEAEWASADFVPQEVTCIGETTDQSLRGQFYCRTKDRPSYGLGEAGSTAQ